MDQEVKEIKTLNTEHSTLSIEQWALSVSD